MKGFTQLTLAALAAYASASAVNPHKRDTPLSVVLTASGNSEVKVAVTNNGDKALNLLSKGTFLDEENPVEKVTLYAAGGSTYNFLYKPTVPIRAFLGISTQISITSLHYRNSFGIR